MMTNSVKYIYSNVPGRWLLSLLITIFFSMSCEDPGYDVQYPDGYPDKIAGNWVAFDYQIPKNNYLDVIDTINYFNLTEDAGFKAFTKLLKPSAISDRYDLVTSLDPSVQNSIIISNIYNSGVRTRAAYASPILEARLSDQLEVINRGSYNIYYVSVSGQIVEDPQGDMLFIITGLYDEQKDLLESFFITGYRKTGFEDTDYRSLLNK